MNTSLTLLVKDMLVKGIRAEHISSVFGDRLFVEMADHVIEIKKNSEWYFLQYKCHKTVLVKLKLKIIGNTNADTMQLIDIAKKLSTYYPNV